MTTATLAAALDALARVDDADARPGDHDCAEQLDRLCDEAAWRIADDLYAMELARFEAWHAEVCDNRDKTCHHYQPMEG